MGEREPLLRLLARIGIVRSRLEGMGFECPGGPLQNCTDWILLETLLEQMGEEIIQLARVLRETTE